MKQLVIKEILKMCAKSFVITAVIGGIIGIIGYINKWNSSISYSNAFFIAGCLVIIGGTASRFTASQDWHEFQMLDSESFRGMSSSERINFIINASSPLSAVILGLLSGILLILISAFVLKLF